MAGDFNGFKFLHHGVDGKKLMRLQSETSFLKFLAVGVLWTGPVSSLIT